MRGGDEQPLWEVVRFPRGVVRVAALAGIGGPFGLDSAGGVRLVGGRVSVLCPDPSFRASKFLRGLRRARGGGVFPGVSSGW